MEQVVDKLELYELMTGGEDSLTEFKRDVTQRSDFASEMIALANTGGGQILLGVEDDGTIVGVSNADSVEQSVLNIARHNCNPPLIPLIDRVATDQGLVLVVTLSRYVGPPHENNSGQCFVRVGSTKRLCTPQERARMLQAAGLYHYDESSVPGTSLQDIHIESFGHYYFKVYEQALDQAEVPLQRMLENMRFVVRGTDNRPALSIAGLLLFGNHPQEFLAYARISAVRWAGVEAGEEIIDRQEIEARLPQQIQYAEAFVLRNTRLSTFIESVQQTDVYQYPRPALREAIVNAVAHRDYSLEGAQILLYIFDDRLEIRSPGTLPNGITLENIRTHYSKARNETVARVLFNLGYVNTLGSGIPRMIRLMREQTGREPEFEIKDQQFMVRLWARPDVQPLV